MAVIATAGNILDLADSSAVDITASDLMLLAGTAIASSGNALETSVANLATWSKNGGTFINETDSITVRDLSVTVNRVGTDGTAVATAADSQQDVVVAGGNLVLATTNGFITTTAATGEIAVSGNILLQSGETAEGTTSDFTLNATGTSSGGSVSIVSKDSILQNHADADTCH